MDKRHLKRLEFDKVLQKLAGHTRSPLGRELVDQLLPRADREEVKHLQAETTEGRELLRLDPGADLGGWHDVREEVDRSRRGIVLEPQELDRMGKTLAATRRIKKFLLERRERYPLLATIAEQLGNFSSLEKQVTSCVLPGGEIADHASPELAAIRRRLSSARQQVKDRLDRITRSPDYQKYLQDPIVTIREGRYVIPVKQEYRSQVPGIVHDQSASGATVFVEPMGVVEANNEVRRLEAAERQEILKILASLSQQVADRAGELSETLANLGRLDFIMAKARYSEQLDAWEPELVDRAVLNIKRGRHPLLPGEVVPISLHLGYSFDTLVVTGPNTGGKTVTLKTVGLMVLMAQAGLHVPAGEGTVIGMFRQVFVDIGDEQSIEQSLSTFSSHMSNIVEIIDKAGPGSLVLLDELGAGTDPTEGAALAQAILEHLHNLGTRTIATTHYSELKNFAFSRERIENTSVEFDPVTLQPTYKLLLGQPGRSNAFEIAKRLGLNTALVEKAKKYMSREQVEVAELMHDLEVAKYRAEEERKKAEELRQEAGTLRDRYHRLEKELEKKKGEIISKARSEAREMVRRTRLEAEELIRQLRRQLEESDARAREQAVQKAREQLKKMRGRYAANETGDRQATGRAPREVKPGMEVFVPKFNQSGIVVEGPDSGGEVQVQLGVVKINLSLVDLRLPGKDKAGAGRQGVTTLVKHKARDIKSELDLRGMRAAEAVEKLDKYLDDAALAGLGKVYIIHGKGTGALRVAIQEQLKNHRNVKSFRLGGQGEGGSGVTVVDLH